ncbi:hypothetical protein PROFUN_12208 [Planoprotostelium fungivorum]|uniref:Sugar phosphate transporter domain-containing protein n=1 Tax=Planoprotostelium fungivorum TaxID=1890364 RepID=A0A2P6N856_9EUKA|nr:hypothetical protein PROFUN_12208 [Planoprotostelium fungivorum]
MTKGKDDDAPPGSEPNPLRSMKDQQADALYAQTIFLVVGFYFFISIALVFLNKNIMSVDFPFPLFVTWYQLVVALVIVGILGHLGKSYPMLSIIPPLEFNVVIAQKVLPLAVVFVGMVAFNNLCLANVEVTFYQVVRSLTIVFTIIFTFTILGQSTSMATIQASAIVVLGFFVGSYGEVNFSWAGVIYGVTSSAFVSLYGIYVKKVMSAVNGDQWRLLIYNTGISIVLMLPTLWLMGEASELSSNPKFYELSNWIGMTVTGIFGFLINIAVFLQIKYTSPLTNNISGTLKACLQTLFAMIWYQNEVSSMAALGIFLVIAGSAYYSQVKYSEMKKNTEPTLPTTNPSNRN